MSFLQNAVRDAVETFQKLSGFETPLNDAARIVLRCLTAGHKLLVCGNGGSAADGADFSTEFTCRFMGDRRPYPAMNLSVGGSLVTAVGHAHHVRANFPRPGQCF